MLVKVFYPWPTIVLVTYTCYIAQILNVLVLTCVLERLAGSHVNWTTNVRVMNTATGIYVNPAATQSTKWRFVATAQSAFWEFAVKTVWYVEKMF